jgi:hypothetical protein
VSIELWISKRDFAPNEHGYSRIAAKDGKRADTQDQKDSCSFVAEIPFLKEE